MCGLAKVISPLWIHFIADNCSVPHGVSMTNVWDVIYIKLFSAMWMNTVNNENKPKTYFIDYGFYCSLYFKAMFSFFFWEVKVWYIVLWALITKSLIALLVGISKFVSLWGRWWDLYLLLYCIYLYYGIRLQVLLICNMYKCGFTWFQRRIIDFFKM